MEYAHMPYTSELVAKVVESCKEEWMESRDGARYKTRYKQLKDELKKIEGEIDSHVASYVREKHGY